MISRDRCHRDRPNSSDVYVVGSVERRQDEQGPDQRQPPTHSPSHRQPNRKHHLDHRTITITAHPRPGARTLYRAINLGGPALDDRRAGLGSGYGRQRVGRAGQLREPGERAQPGHRHRARADDPLRGLGLEPDHDPDHRDPDRHVPGLPHRLGRQQQRQLRHPPRRHPRPRRLPIRHGGRWERLGPWPATITDGSLDLTAGPDANLSGIELWHSGSNPRRHRRATARRRSA